MASRIKKILRLLPTRSQFPSSVYILTANPRGHAAFRVNVSQCTTVEKRINKGVLLPFSCKNFALVYLETGSLPTVRKLQNNRAHLLPGHVPRVRVPVPGYSSTSRMLTPTAISARSITMRITVTIWRLLFQSILLKN